MNEQLNLLSKQELRFTKSWSFGGQSLKRRRKTKRPLLPNKKIHIVFKASKATGPLSFLANGTQVNALLKERAKKYFICIHEHVNMGNHLHLKVSCKDIKKLQNFLRTFAAILARKLTGACRGNKFGKFWDGLVFTRVLHSTFEALSLKGYFTANHRERESGKQSREIYLQNFNQFLMKLKRIKALRQTEAKMLMELG